MCQGGRLGKKGAGEGALSSDPPSASRGLAELTQLPSICQWGASWAEVNKQARLSLPGLQMVSSQLDTGTGVPAEGRCVVGASFPGIAPSLS